MTCGLSGYTDEEPEVLKYKVNIWEELKVHLVTKVEREKKTKSRTVWEELKLMGPEAK